MANANASSAPDAPPSQRRSGVTNSTSKHGILDNIWEGFNSFNVLLLPRRVHWFELEDLDICPSFLRARTQSTLTAQWTHRMPILQRTAPTTLATDLLRDLIGKLEASSTSSSTDFSKASATSSSPSSTAPITIVDFCSGAGGPTPYIEHELNMRRLAVKKAPINFLLTDLHPNIDAWMPLAERSETLNFIPQSVDAGRPPAAVISAGSGRGSARGVVDGYDATGGVSGKSSGKLIVRTFYLSFHHFDDEQARRILKSTLETSDGFAIVELMDRRLFSLLMLMLEPLLVFLVAPMWFFTDPVYLFFTFVIPALPVIMGWDGIVSLLRTRTFDEVLELVDEAMGWKGPKSGYGTWLSTDGGNRTTVIEREGWVFESSRRLHTWPLGYCHWVVGRKING